MKKIDLSKISKITEPLFKAMDKIGKLSKLYRFLISLGIIVLFAGPIVYFSYLPKMEKIDKLTGYSDEPKTEPTTYDKIKHESDKEY